MNLGMEIGYGSRKKLKAHEHECVCYVVILSLRIKMYSWARYVQSVNTVRMKAFICQIPYERP